mmetsp:Transcript_18200/g.61363  ORF Transcript_18200/g.61363 Transcript_18200/m.61363 type:complete len:233 (+) Transcript_18200:843-1541(+)
MTIAGQAKFGSSRSSCCAALSTSATVAYESAWSLQNAFAEEEPFFLAAENASAARPRATTSEAHLPPKSRLSAFARAAAPASPVVRKGSFASMAQHRYKPEARGLPFADCDWGLASKRAYKAARPTRGGKGSLANARPRGVMHSAPAWRAPSETRALTAASTALGCGAFRAAARKVRAVKWSALPFKFASFVGATDDRVAAKAVEWSASASRFDLKSSDFLCASILSNLRWE